MKVILLWFFSFLLFTITIFSQTHSIYFSSGYNIPTTTSVINNYSSKNSIPQFISTYSEGIVFQGGYQYTVFDNLALDINLSYLPGYENKKYLQETNGGYSLYSNSYISLSPTVNVKVNVGNFSPYTKFGISINIINLKTKWDPDNTYNSYEYLYKGNITVGFVGGIGINYLFSKSFNFFLETQLNSLTYYPDELELTQYFNDGSKITDVYQLKENTISNDEGISAAVDFPFSSIGIILGLRLVL